MEDNQKVREVRGSVLRFGEPSEPLNYDISSILEHFIEQKSLISEEYISMNSVIVVE